MMTKPPAVCLDERRRADVRAHGSSGIDYVEVSHDRLTLTVYLFGRAPKQIAKGNVRIEGGVRVRSIQVIDLRRSDENGSGGSGEPPDDDHDDYVQVMVDKAG